MKTLKKWTMTILSLACACMMAFGLAACGGKGKDNSSSSSQDDTPIEVAYTLTLTDQDGVAVAGAELRITQEEEDIATGTTDADGKMSGTLMEGDYVVVFDDLPSGYVGSVKGITISRNTPAFTVTVENMTPNGSLERPYAFIPDAYGNMEITLPASTSVYYSISRPWGRTVTVEGSDFKLEYVSDAGGTVTLTPTAGKIEVALGDGEAANAYEVVKVLLINESATANEIKMILPVPAGSEPSVAIQATLNDVITAEVKGNRTVYYTYTAAAEGTLTISSTDTNAKLYMYNNNTFQATGEEGAKTLTVHVGDVISIQISAKNASGTVEIPFTLTLA